MAIWQSKEDRAERARIKNIEPAGSRHNLEVGNKKRDRRVAALIVGSPIVGLLVLYGYIRNYGDPPPEGQNSPGASLPIPPNLKPDVRPPGACNLPDMRGDPAQTRVLQEFLKFHEDEYYNGPIDGLYDQDVVEAVKEFQEDAKEDGVYTFEVDGIPGYYTCQAMGEPYFEDN